MRTEPPTLKEDESGSFACMGGKSGQGGIRTPGTVTRTQHFQCCTFSRSVTCPQAGDESRPGGGHRASGTGHQVGRLDERMWDGSGRSGPGRGCGHGFHGRVRRSRGCGTRSRGCGHDCRARDRGDRACDRSKSACDRGRHACEWSKHACDQSNHTRYWTSHGRFRAQMIGFRSGFRGKSADRGRKNGRSGLSTRFFDRIRLGGEGTKARRHEGTKGGEGCSVPGA